MLWMHFSTITFKKTGKFNISIIYSSSSPASSSPFSAAFARFRRLRPGRPPANADPRAKSICFCESRRTMKEGTLTIYAKKSLVTSPFFPREYLWANADMPLTDQYSGMVNGFCKSQFEYLCLQSPFQKIFDFESKHIVQFHARFVKDTDSNETTNQGISFKQTTGISLWESATYQFKIKGEQTFKSKKFTSGSTDFRERKLNSPGSNKHKVVYWSEKYQISRLLRRPYSPASFNSASKRAASKGL